MTLPPLSEEATSTRWREHWDLAPGVTYFQHGAKGLPPRPVLEAWIGWIRRIESNPMEFVTRSGDGHMNAARARLAAFVGCAADDLVFMINTTLGVHAVAASVSLGPGDEVVLSDHEYGIVQRTWRRACERTGARLVTAAIACPVRSAEGVVEAYWSAVGPRTRVLVCSHITSPTGLVFPVEELCRRARAAGVLTCVDGAHALAVRPLDLAALDCDFYAASCHKWLAAPSGSGFLYAHPRVQAMVQPLVVSLGASWRDVGWICTRDFTPFLGVPAALDFLEDVGVDLFRRRTHELARYVRARVGALTGLEPLSDDSADWYGSMVSLPLPDGDAGALRAALWKDYGIEVGLAPWNGRNLLRVSCHLYTTPDDIDRLAAALKALGVGGSHAAGGAS